MITKIIESGAMVLLHFGNARGESRTRTGLPPTDFESVASAIPPLGQGAKTA